MLYILTIISMILDIVFVYIILSPNDFNVVSRIIRGLYIIVAEIYFVIRIKEKFVWEKLMSIFSNKRVSNESLNAFLNSAINIEYVYLILTGINNFMEL